MKFRCSRFTAEVSLFVLFLISGNVPAQTLPTFTNDFPQLLPPYAELPPTFWEQHGSLILAACCAAILLLALTIWICRRARLEPVIPPAIQARRDLEELRDQIQNGEVLSRVSQILRRYFVSVYDLTEGELTTSEFSQRLLANNQMEPQLAQASSQFLQQCDDRKFSPAQPNEPFDAVTGALALIEQSESLRTRKPPIRA